VIAVSLVAVGISAYVLLFADSDSDDEAANRQSQVNVVFQRTLISPAGIRMSLLKGWEGERSGKLVRASSADGTTKVAVAHKGGAAGARRAFRQSIDGVKAGLTDARVSYPTEQGRLAGLRSATAVVTGRTQDGVKVRVLVTVARGIKRAWVASVATPAGGGRLAEAQLILNEVELDG
jgi:hypothetical protein